MVLMTKDQILGALPGLNVSDLTQIQHTLNHLLGATEGQAVQGATLQGQGIFEALTAALGATVPYSSFAVTASGPKFEKKVPELINFLDTNFKGWDKNKIVQFAFLSTLFQFLANDLKARGVPPTFGSMIVNMSRLPEVFDNEFPDYRKSGMATIILKRIQSKL